jgi:hypothetical protein
MRNSGSISRHDRLQARLRRRLRIRGRDRKRWEIMTFGRVATVDMSVIRRSLAASGSPEKSKTGCCGGDSQMLNRRILTFLRAEGNKRPSSPTIR